MPKTNQRQKSSSRDISPLSVIAGIFGILIVITTIAFALLASEVLHSTSGTRLPGWVVDIGAVALVLFIISGAIKTKSEGNSNE